MTDAEIEEYIANHQEEPSKDTEIDTKFMLIIADIMLYIKAHIPSWCFWGAGKIILLLATGRTDR